MQKEKEFELIDEIAKVIADDESKNTVVDIDREKMVTMCSKSFRNIASGNKLKITCGLHEPFESVGYIEAIGESIVINDTHVFCDIIKNASNIELVPHTNNSIEVNLTFHGLSKKEDR